MDQQHTIVIAEDFSRFPGGRYRKDGDFSGEQFRDDFLIPALRRYPIVRVVLDGTAGYAASFLEEAFGGLIRSGELAKSELGSRLVIGAGERFKTYKRLAERYVREAREARALTA
jgi:hypothetical protein